MKTEKLRVTSLQFKDVLGAREFSMEPGAVNVISGKNASGKTTAIEAIKAAIGGGNLANLARIGEEDEEINPEIVLVLEGDTEQYRVEKDVKKTRVRKRVGDSAGFEDVPSPQRWLDGLFDSRLANPIKLLNAPNKERILMLLGALDVTLDRDALWKAMGIEKKDVGAVPEGLHPLQELALIREAVFRERTGVNRDATQKVASAEQTRRATPAVLPDGHEKEIEALDSEIAKSDVGIAKVREQSKHICEERTIAIQAAANADSEGERAKCDGSAVKRRAALEIEIATEHKMIEVAIREKEQIVAQEVAKLEAARDETLESLAMDQKGVEDKRVHLAELREQAKAAIKARTLHEQAEQFDAEAEALTAMSDKLTGAIDAVDAYRRNLANDLPIPGLEVDGKIIKVDGIPLDQLNNQQRIDIAVKIACIRAKDHRLPIVWIDGAEALDPENFAALKKSLRAAGVQPFIGRVEGTGLTVTTEE